MAWGTPGAGPRLQGEDATTPTGAGEAGGAQPRNLHLGEEHVVDAMWLIKHLSSPFPIHPNNT